MKTTMQVDRTRRARSSSSSQHPPGMPSPEEASPLSKSETKIIADSIYDFLDWFLKDEHAGDRDEEWSSPVRAKGSKAASSVPSKKQTLLDTFSAVFGSFVPPPAARKRKGNTTSERPLLVTALLQSMEDDQDGIDGVVTTPHSNRNGFSHGMSAARQAGRMRSVSPLPPVWDDYYQILQSSIRSGELPPDTRHPRGFLSWCVHQQWVYKQYHNDKHPDKSSGGNDQASHEAATSTKANNNNNNNTVVSEIVSAIGDTASKAKSRKSIQGGSDTETDEESRSLAKAETKRRSLKTSSDQDGAPNSAPEEDENVNAALDVDKKARTGPDDDDDDDKAKAGRETDKEKAKTAAAKELQPSKEVVPLKTHLSHLNSDRIAKLNRLGFEWENTGSSNDLLVERPLPFSFALELYGPVLLEMKRRSDARRIERRSKTGTEATSRTTDLEKSAREWLHEQTYRYREWDAGFAEFPLVEREALGELGLLPTLFPSKEAQESLLALSEPSRHDASIGNSDDDDANDETMYDSPWLRKEFVNAVRHRDEDDLFDKEIEIPTPDTSRYEEKFDSRYQELKKFRRKYGHVYVTTMLNKPLANWIRKQRARYRELGDSYPADRKAKLDELGLDWNPKISKPPTGTPPAGTGYALIEAKWQKHLNNLKKFKEKFGHVHVTKKWKHLFPGLCVWVNHQKEYYRNWKVGRFDLPAHRRKAREEIGLVGPNASNLERRNPVYVERGDSDEKPATKETEGHKRKAHERNGTRKSPRLT